MAEPAEQVVTGGAVSQGETDVQATEAVQQTQDVDAAIKQAVDAATQDFKKKLSEFRENNINLSKKLQEWQSLGDHEHLKTIIQNVSKNEEARLAAEGKFDELLALRTEPMRKDYETRLSAAHEARDQLEQKVKDFERRVFDLRISNEVANAARGNADVNADAIPLIVDMAGKVWRVEEDGEYVPRRPNGARWIGRDGKTDITFSEWVSSLKDSFPSLFKSPTGPNVRGGPAGKPSIEWLNSLPPLDRIEKMRELGLKK